MWRDFEAGAPDLAAKARERFGGEVAYLATVRKDGGPRVHPITPIVSAERLFVFMEPTSPKGYDLQRHPLYALHSAVDDNEGGGGEVYITGEATFIEDKSLRETAAEAASYSPAERYVLFELGVEFCLVTIYEEGEPKRERWRAEGV